MNAQNITSALDFSQIEILLQKMARLQAENLSLKIENISLKNKYEDLDFLDELEASYTS